MLGFSYVLTFLLSSTLEVPVYAFAYRSRLSFAKVFGIVTLANLVTHPLVFFGFMSSRWPYLWAVLGAELFAILAESFIHRACIPGISLKRTLHAAFWANIVSWQVAPMITWYALSLL
jgi:hypothetical protein